MSDQTITSLIEKLEGAEGPSIALDAEICWTLERDRATSAFWRGAMGRPEPLPDEFSRLPRGLGMASLEAGSPNYTASLDAALALAERVLPGDPDFSPTGPSVGWKINLYRGMVPAPLGGWIVNLRRHATEGFEGQATTAALAICAAILRAQSEARV